MQSERLKIEDSLKLTEAKYQELRRNAKALELLYDVFNEFREKAKKQYISPYKDSIEAYARLIWGKDVQIEINPETFQ